MDGRRWRSWRDAMQDTLYGDNGFYRSSGAPGRHFRTAAHTSPLWAAALAELAHRVDRSLGEPDAFTIVDVGAGGGELLAGLSGLAPARWHLIGVDVAPRPARLPDRVAWSESMPSSVTGLLLANEWLDVVPVDVVELTEQGLRLVEVADDGAERLGRSPDRADTDWLAQWWPLTAIGDRAEVGSPRDEAWSDVVAKVVDRGVAIAIDYAVDRYSDVAGTLTGYRGGRQQAPVPDGSCDITAHVMVDSVAAAVTDADTWIVRQRETLLDLGMTGERPSYNGDPLGYVTALSRAGEAAELLDAQGLGGFAWVVTTKGCASPVPGVTAAR